MSNQKEESSESLKGLFVGVLLGVGLAWFLTSEEGSKFRKKLVEESGDLLEKTRESLDETLKDRFVEGEIEE